jgi:hypothetical protein
MNDGASRKRSGDNARRSHPVGDAITVILGEALRAPART